MGPCSLERARCSEGCTVPDLIPQTGHFHSTRLPSDHVGRCGRSWKSTCIFALTCNCLMSCPWAGWKGNRRPPFRLLNLKLPLSSPCFPADGETPVCTDQIQTKTHAFFSSCPPTAQTSLTRVLGLVVWGRRGCVQARCNTIFLVGGIMPLSNWLADANPVPCNYQETAARTSGTQRRDTSPAPRTGAKLRWRWPPTGPGNSTAKPSWRFHKLQLFLSTRDGLSEIHVLLRTLQGRNTEAESSVICPRPPQCKCYASAMQCYAMPVTWAGWLGAEGGSKATLLSWAQGDALIATL